MALITHTVCPTCRQPRTFVNGKCPHCEAKRERKRVKAWNKKGTKAKLDDLRKRIEVLEAGPQTY